MKRASLIFFIIMFVGTNELLAHGVVYEISKEEAFIIKIAYDDGIPMNYAEVKVFSPGDQKIEYQNGRTDKNGRFVFFPDKAGKWKIEVNDGMGHGVITDVSIEEGLKLKEKTRGHLTRWQKILFGLSLIIGITGILFYFSARQYMKGEKDAYS